MLNGAQDLLASQRGVMCIVLVIASTVLAALGVITGSDWLAFAKLIGIALIASRTVTGSVETIATKGAVVMARRHESK